MSKLVSWERVERSGQVTEDCTLFNLFTDCGYDNWRAVNETPIEFMLASC